MLTSFLTPKNIYLQIQKSTSLDTVIHDLYNRGLLNNPDIDAFIRYLSHISPTGNWLIDLIADENGLFLFSEKGHRIRQYMTPDILTQATKISLERDENIRSRILHLAALKGRLDLVKILLDNGANINAKTQNGVTALIIAAKNHHAEVVEFLLNSGANLDDVDYNNDTALTFAEAQDYHDVSFVIESFSPSDCLDLARIYLDDFYQKRNASHIRVIRQLNALLIYQDSTQFPEGSALCAEALFLLGDFYLTQTQNIELALETLQNVSKNHPEHYKNAQYSLANHCLSVNQFEQALYHAIESENHVLTMRLCSLIYGSGVAEHNDAIQKILQGDKDALITDLISLMRQSKSNISEDIAFFDIDSALQTQDIVDHSFCPPPEGGLKNKELPDMSVPHLTPQDIYEKIQQLKSIDSVIHDLHDIGCLSHQDTNAFLMYLNEISPKGNGVFDLMADNRGLSILFAEDLRLANLITEDTLTQATYISLEMDVAIRSRMLFFVTLNGREDLVHLLLQREVDPNARYIDDFTSLIIAAQEGHTNIVERLLACGATIDIQTPIGCTALIMAAQNGHTDTIKSLIAHRATLDIRTKKGCTALFSAAQKGHIAIVEHLLAGGANLDIQTINGLNPLLIAVQEGHTGIVKRLLAGGVNISQLSNQRMPAIHIAAYKGHIDMVELLLTYGVQINQPNHQGFTALIIAAYNDNAEMIECLLAHGAHINQPNHFGMTALIAAAHNGHMKIVKCLLAGCARNNQAVHQCFFSVMYAARNGHVEIAEYILTRGADINRQSKFGMTALMYAAQNGYTKLVEHLLARGANMKSLNNNKQTALMLAAENGHTDTLDFFFGFDGDIDLEENDHQRSTALILAAKKGHAKAVSFLLNSGANMDAVDCKHDTAREIGKHKQYAEVCSVIDNFKPENCLTLAKKYLNDFHETRNNSHIKVIRQLNALRIYQDSTQFPEGSALCAEALSLLGHFYLTQTQNMTLALETLHNVSKNYPEPYKKAQNHLALHFLSVDQNELALYYAIRSEDDELILYLCRLLAGTNEVDLEQHQTILYILQGNKHALMSEVISLIQQDQPRIAEDDQLGAINSTLQTRRFFTSSGNKRTLESSMTREGNARKSSRTSEQESTVDPTNWPFLL